MQLGNALYPLIEDVAPLEEILEKYQTEYLPRHVRMMSDKLGLKTDADAEFVLELENLLYKSEMDMTLFFRRLNRFDENAPDEFWTELEKSSYSETLEKFKPEWTEFLTKYAELLIARKKRKVGKSAEIKQRQPEIRPAQLYGANSDRRGGRRRFFDCRRAFQIASQTIRRTARIGKMVRHAPRLGKNQSRLLDAFVQFVK